MKRFAIYVSVFFQVFLFFGLPAFAADDPTSLLTGGLNNAAADAGYNQTLTMPVLIGRFIGIMLGLIGIIFIVYLVWAGIMYMTAAGDDTKVKKAKQMINQSIIGIIIMVSSYALSSFIISQLTTAVSVN